MQLTKYSIGVGDRFAHQAAAQLQACVLAAQAGVEVTPVWNKSNREHLIIGSGPAQTREAADSAVRAAGWGLPYFVDADHIQMATYARYVGPCDFFTIDVADRIGQSLDDSEIEDFVQHHPEWPGSLHIPGVDRPMHLDRAFIKQTARQFLAAVREAGRIYRAIAAEKGTGQFVAEVSMDETSTAQTPAELLIILAAIADEDIPLQTIAPKFTGSFLKGVDYRGDPDRFALEFREDLATIAYAIDRYDLPGNLKLSVHSGSDKYSIYPSIHAALRDSNAGVHVKTAGTTWLEELIGLAEGDGDALQMAKQIFVEAYAHAEELCAPYTTVIRINPERLPTPASVQQWTSDQFTAALRHTGPRERQNSSYNPDLRQLLHVAFKIAAKMGKSYTDALQRNSDVIGRNVTGNLFERHIRPIFLGE